MTIKEAREKANLTQQQLAEEIGVRQKDISRWENGRRRPKFEALKKIADACKVPVELLLPGHGTKLRRAREKSGFCNYPDTCADIFSRISPALADSCTADQLAEIARAINAAFHSGRANAGAEVIDGSYVWVDCLDRGFELDDLRRFKSKETSTTIVKHYDGNLVDDAEYERDGELMKGCDIGNYCDPEIWAEWTRKEKIEKHEIYIDKA